MTEVDNDWDLLFEKYDIVNRVNSDGYFSITADQIKKFHEPRLMTKFDWSAALPRQFKDNKLVILPSTRGTYVIGRFQAYQPLIVESPRPKLKTLPSWATVLSGFKITSESIALNIAKASGMIDEIMDSDPEIPSIDAVTGRLGSGDLKFNIQRKSANTQKKEAFAFSVQNAQVEIDGGFENTDRVALIEAKMHIPKDFMIRQLYYPLRIYQRHSGDKEVTPFYFTYSDEIFNFFEFHFKDPNDYSSIQQIKQYSFILNTTLSLTIDEIKKISDKSKLLDEPTNVPYPQANTFSMIMDLLHLLVVPMKGLKIAEDLDFDIRQSYYYANALIYLGFAVKERHNYKLTQLGKYVESLPNSNMRNEIIVRQILDHKSFKYIFDDYIRNGTFDNQFIEKIVLRYAPKVNKITAGRRGQTVKKWISWIVSVTSE